MQYSDCISRWLHFQPPNIVGFSALFLSACGGIMLAPNLRQ
jgi:hypothetical protein